MKIVNRTYILVALGFMILGLVLGRLFFHHSHSEPTMPDEAIAKSTIWTCSMHPQIRRDEPGQCPICGMDLVPLSASMEGDGNPMEIKMSPTAMQLANVQTSIIRKQKPVKEVRISGKVNVDERKVFSQSSHIPGRIEKLLVSFEGEEVRKGQVLAYVYSPELVTAQEELFQTYKIRKKQPALYQAARKKLVNWKLTDGQIDDIIEVGSPQEQFPVLADVSGVVLTKQVNLGDYVRKGENLFKIADLSRVWVLFDVYENDMMWVRKGDEISFRVRSFPGESFNGRISFVDPVIDPKTRVASARVEMPNKNGRLKPDMFVLGTIKSVLENREERLIVPKTAVMWTGERSVVYVKGSVASGIGFVMREVELGPSLGDSYVINGGLQEGEEIATNGTFSIDAAAQLAGKPSMMNPEGGGTMLGHNHGGLPHSSKSSTTGVEIDDKAKKELMPLIEDYLSLKNALVSDDLGMGLMSASQMQTNLKKVPMRVFKGEAHLTWMKHSKMMESALDRMVEADNIGTLRRYFKELSDQFIMLAISFGPFDKDLYIQHCPMANDNKGADWISGNEEIKNPYFGESMIGCGSITRRLE